MGVSPQTPADYFAAHSEESEALYQCIVAVRNKPALGFELAIASPGRFSWLAVLRVLRDPDACPAALRAVLVS